MDLGEGSGGAVPGRNATIMATLLCSADDGTLPLRPGETAREVLAQRRDLELHSYYDDIAHLTFPTGFVSVDLETARAWRVYNRGGELNAIFIYCELCLWSLQKAISGRRPNQ